jgi:hypothetical protein
VNCTDWPAAGAAGAKLNEAARTDILATVTVWLPCFDPELVEAVKVTV